MRYLIRNPEDNQLAYVNSLDGYDNWLIEGKGKKFCPKEGHEFTDGEWKLKAGYCEKTHKKRCERRAELENMDRLELIEMIEALIEEKFLELMAKEKKND